MKVCRSCCAPGEPIIGTLCFRLLGCRPLTNSSDVLDGTTISVTGPGPVRGSPGIASRGVTAITVTAVGSGYDSPATATITGGGGSGATALVSLNNGTIASVGVTAGGVGYTRIPTLTLGSPGTGASLTATLTPTTVGSITVTNPGSGYTEATATITGGGGSGATADVVLDGDEVGEVVITSGGFGYTGAPITVTITGDGSGAAATATITPTSVGSIAVNSGGTGYSESTFINFINTGGGVGAQTRIFLANARVATVLVTKPGTGFTSTPAVTISGATGGSGATTAAILTVQACFGVDVAGTYSYTVTRPATALGARFAPTFSGSTGLIIGSVNINVPMGAAAGYHCSGVCDHPLKDTLFASAAGGTVTVTHDPGTSLTWTGCNAFPGGDARLVGATCTVEGSGNTPVTLQFGTHPTTFVPSVLMFLSTCCSPSSGVAAVPHYRWDTTCASLGLGGAVDAVVSAITVVSCDPVVFTVTVPSNTTACQGSTNTLAIPMAGTVTFTE